MPSAPFGPFALTDNVQFDSADGGTGPFVVHAANVVASRILPQRLNQQQRQPSSKVEFEGSLVPIQRRHKMSRLTDVCIACIDTVNGSAEDVAFVPKD